MNMSKKRSRDVPRAPAGLSAAIRAWWKQVNEMYSFQQHELELLRLACFSLQRGEQAREAIAKAGLTYEDAHKVVRPNPAILVERNATAQFAKLCRQLKLDELAESQARPASIRSYSAKTA
jgi:P27 family predicted phage terminase small subunit